MASVIICTRSPTHSQSSMKSAIASWRINRQVRMVTRLLLQGLFCLCLGYSVGSRNTVLWGSSLHLTCRNPYQNGTHLVMEFGSWCFYQVRKSTDSNHYLELINNFQLQLMYSEEQLHNHYKWVESCIKIERPPCLWTKLPPFFRKTFDTTEFFLMKFLLLTMYFLSHYNCRRDRECWHRSPAAMWSYRGNHGQVLWYSGTTPCGEDVEFHLTFFAIYFFRGFM